MVPAHTTDRRRRALSTVLLLALTLTTNPSEPQTRFDGEGRVVAIDEARGSITLEHGPIADVFPADRTEFPVQDLALLRRVRVGDTVSFSVRIAESGGLFALSTLVPKPEPERKAEPAGARLEYLLLAAAVLFCWVAVLALMWIQGHRLERALDQVTKDVTALDVRHARDGTRSDVRELVSVLGQIGTVLRDGYARDVRRHVHGIQTALREAGGNSGADASNLLIVRRGDIGLLKALQDRLEVPSPVHVIWDRRMTERRTSLRRPPGPERRRAERRAPPHTTWTALGFVLTSGASKPETGEGAGDAA